MPDKKTRLRDTLTVLVILTNFEARIMPCFDLSSQAFLPYVLPGKMMASTTGQCDAGTLPGGTGSAPVMIRESQWEKLCRRFAPRSWEYLLKNKISHLNHTVGNACFRYAVRHNR